METPVVEPRLAARSAILYIRVLLCSFCIPLLLVMGILYGIQATGRLPALPLTGNVDFNEKALFVRKALRSPYDVVAAGSSMALNNLSTDVLTAEMPGRPRVLNIGVGGLKLSDTRRWLEHALKYTHPRSVILVAGFMDFYSPGLLTVTDGELDTFLSDSRLSRLFEFVRHFVPQYYVDNWSTVRTLRLSRASFVSVDFDRGGAVPLELYFPDVDLTRWDMPKLSTPSEDQYAQLASLAKELRGRGIDLVVTQAPLRRQALIAARMELDRHWRRLKTIADQTEQRFFDLHDLGFDDSYFADYSHLNAKGARAFTRELGSRLTTQSGPSP